MARTTPILRAAKRELHHGWRHFATFLACLILGVAVIATIGTLAAAIQHTMENEADSLLGGNVEVTLNGNAATPEQLALLQRFGKVSHIATTRAMLRLNGLPLLIEAKAVDDAYPLLGELRLAPPATRAAFQPDGIVVDKALLEQYGAKVGDEVNIGTGTFRITGVLDKEPDRVVQIFTFGPRVMMSHAALDRTGITSGYSLVRHSYRLLLTGGADPAALQSELEAAFAADTWRLRTTTDGNESVDRFLAQLTLFLSLSGLATFLIGGIGIGSAVRAYMEKKTESIAVMKTLGASRAQILQIFLLVIGVLTVAGSLVGIGIAAIGVEAFLPVIGQWLPVAEGSAFDIDAALLAGWYGILISCLFSIPSLMNALDIRPSLLFRHAAGIVALPRSRGAYVAPGVILLVLLVTLALNYDDMRFVGGFVGVAVLAFIVFAVITRGVQVSARRIRVRSPWLRLALGNLHRPGATTGTIILAIGVSLTVLVAVTLTEANFQRRIGQVVDAEAPTLFLMDIQPSEAEGVQALLAQAAPVDKIMVYPMVRGSIVKLNGNPVVKEEVAEDVRWAVRGDRGLSFGALPPKNVQFAQGEWWPQDYRGEPLVSVDERLLAGMGLALGDSITVEILGEEVTAKIASSRRINYTTFQMNFALMFSPGAIDDFPKSLLATVYLPPERSPVEVMRQLAASYPTVTVINTVDAVSRVKEVLERVATALSITVAISLLAGLLVLSSALSAMLGYRLYDTAVLKVLGARRRDILLAYTTEWMMLAAVTALVAAGLGTFGAWLIMLRFPGDAPFYAMPQVTMSTLLGCMVVIWLIGYLGNRSVFRLRPAGLLRNE